MPTYGEEKRRDMARSVLPSRRAKGAREDKRRVHGEVRSRIRDLIVKGDWDNESDLALDPQRHKPYQGIKVVVRDRRDGDNLAPLMRWAEAKADELGDTPEERCAALRAMLPDNIVGWHAMTHVDHLDAFETNPIRNAWRYARADRQASYRENYNKVVRVAHKVFENGGHSAFNIELRRAHVRTGHDRRCPVFEYDADKDRMAIRHVVKHNVLCHTCTADPRLLLGAHDIDEFARDVASEITGSPHLYWETLAYHGEYGAVLDEFDN